jgi:hypothetical protein
VRLPLAAAVLIVFSACSTFQEKHYFRSEDALTGKPVNYFRLTVAGSSAWTKSRYVSGFYDERAVDLFFNETKTNNDDDVKKIFLTDQIAPGTTEKIVPLAPDQHGTFLMIFSSNSKAVTDTLGQFAESQVVADAVTNILNRKEIRESRRSAAKTTTDAARSTAFSTQIEKLLTNLPETASTNVARDQTLRVLQTISRALGGDGQFATPEAGAAWFAGQSNIQSAGAR